MEALLERPKGLPAAWALLAGCQLVPQVPQKHALDRARLAHPQEGLLGG